MAMKAQSESTSGIFGGKTFQSRTLLGKKDAFFSFVGELSFCPSCCT